MQFFSDHEKNGFDKKRLRYPTFYSTNITAKITKHKMLSSRNFPEFEKLVKKIKFFVYAQIFPKTDFFRTPKAPKAISNI